MASSKKDLNKPVTQKQILEVMEMIKEFGTILLEKIEGVHEEVGGVRKEVDNVREEVDSVREDVSGVRKEVSSVRKEVSVVRKEVDGVRKEGGSLRITFESFRDEQRQFNREFSQKVDANTAAIQALDKRVRYQKDMPERLDHVENKQYELERRVNVLEKSK